MRTTTTLRKIYASCFRSIPSSKSSANSMKVYLHHEDEPVYTLRINVDPNKHSLIQDLVQEYLEAFNQRYARSLAIQSLRVLNDDRKPVQLQNKIKSVLEDCGDLFIEQITKTTSTSSNGQPQLTGNSISYPDTSPHTPSPAATSGSNASLQASATSTQTKMPNQQTKTKTAAATPITSSDDKNTTSSASLDERELAARALHQYLEKAQKAADAGNVKLAGDIYTHLLNLLPDNQELLTRAATMWLQKARLPKKALKHAEQLVALEEGSSLAHQLLGDCLTACQQPLEAVKSYDAAISAAQAAGEDSSRVLDLKNPLRTLPWLSCEFQIAMATALHSCEEEPGLRDVAARLVMDVLSVDDKHQPALLLYAHIAEDQGLHADALRVALRLLVTHQHDQRIRSLLARRLQDPDGIQTLYNELSIPDNPINPTDKEKSHASALAFLATVVKENSSVDAAIKLYEKACQLDPLHSGYALNLAHTWELHQRLDKAVAVAAAMLQRAATAGDDRLALAGVLDCQECAGIALSLPPLDKVVCGDAWLQHQPWDPAMTATFFSDKHQAQASDVDKVEYSSSQLDLLALLMTAVKAMYVGGALTAAARLTSLLLPAYKASNKGLHTTLIRNEAAYFGCVLQLFQEHPPPAQHALKDQQTTHQMSQQTVQQPPLYLLGDSHCLSGAWRFVTLRGQQRLLRPVLVTGCKIWHLRPASCFYPKAQFKSSIAALPRGSQLVLLLGEIDCREGLLLAVQKCKYENVDEGIHATVDIYIQVLLDLIQQHDFELFIHPIPPVLNETRSMVVNFTRLLKSKVMEASQTAAAGRKLHYLGFFEQLLTPDGKALNPDYQFDGTHLSPAYMTVLDTALSKVPH